MSHLEDHRNEELSNEITTTYDMESAEDFLWALDLANPFWGLGPRSTLGPRWIFRGHGNADWKLIPSSWRESSRQVLAPFAPLKERAHESSGKSIPWYAHYATQLAAEESIVRAFADLAEEVGNPVPDSSTIKDLPGLLQLADQPSRSLDGSLPITSVHALAQHHGIPTRLLDFTYNPLCAAFFAAQEARKMSVTGSRWIDVWAADRNKFNRRPIRSALEPVSYFAPPYSTSSHLLAQSSVFLYVRGTAAWGCFFVRGHGPAIDTAIEAYVSSDDGKNDREHFLNTFRRVRLPSKEAAKLVDLLWLRKISQAHLMPTYDRVRETLLERFGAS